jgi:hypothetical protein
MHPLLGLSDPPPINYDLTLPPATILTRHCHSLSERSLSEPATNPPLSCITVVVPDLPRGGTIVVTASRQHSFAAVSDVLNEIHDVLRGYISSADFHALPLQNSRRVKSAYDARCNRIGDTRAYQEEKRQGVETVDFLMGLTKFMGLSRTSSEVDVWLLSVS